MVKNRLLSMSKGRAKKYKSKIGINISSIIQMHKIKIF